ncbi:MAG: prepilin-type N-terminal cleavage/methylation domain-containing protein [Bacilli bacterium]|nr:prepilin-type N-terminal cleavage/methylation domain-containing protein [Bacilli bacterium]
MKKLNKKGFTLIELLAVIVILAILIVLAVPAVLNIRTNSTKDLAKAAAASYLKSVQMCISADGENCDDSGSIVGTYYDGKFESGKEPSVSISSGSNKVTSLTFIDPKTGYTVTISDANGITTADVENINNASLSK